MVAKKALRVNLSDLAAKGAKPVGFLLTLALPKSVPEAWLELFARGLGSDAELYGMSAARRRFRAHARPGGDLDHGARHGAEGHAWSAAAARRPGDAVMVTGTIGDAALGLELRDVVTAAKRWKLDNKYNYHLIRRYLLPQPRNALAEAVRLQCHRRDGCVRRSGRRPRQAVRRVRASRPRSRWRACRCRRRRAASLRRSRRRSRGAHRRRRLRDRLHGAAGPARRVPRRRGQPPACRWPRSGGSSAARSRRVSSAATASRCCSSRRPSVISERDGRRDNPWTTGPAATTATVPADQQAAYRGGTKLRTQFPTIAYLRRGAQSPHSALRL